MLLRGDSEREEGTATFTETPEGLTATCARSLMCSSVRPWLSRT